MYGLPRGRPEHSSQNVRGQVVVSCGAQETLATLKRVSKASETFVQSTTFNAGISVLVRLRIFSSCQCIKESDDRAKCVNSAADVGASVLVGLYRWDMIVLDEILAKVMVDELGVKTTLRILEKADEVFVEQHPETRLNVDFVRLAGAAKIYDLSLTTSK
jgi:hypothetical protein